MQITFSEKLIAFLALISGLSISAVAVYYSVVGLTAIFAAAAIPIIIMGAVLEISKLVATVWLKQNWKLAPWSIRGYLLTAIVVLMLITSMGIFGFLSKAHSDQTLISGDIQGKLAIYDEKIKTAKENIEANRKQLKQMDEAVDQVMARSTTEQGADKSNAIRRAQQRDRAALAKDIEANQKIISALNEESAPLRAEVRKVEAEVGPLKYIAAFVYGETDQTVLEKAVVWVIILIVVVFDPLAVILLLASQISFQHFRESKENEIEIYPYVADVGEKPTAEEKAEIEAEGDSPQGPNDVVIGQTTVTEHHPDTHPYLRQGFKYPVGWMFQPPIVAKPETEDKEWQRWVETGEVPSIDDPELKIADQLRSDVEKYGYSSEGNIVKVAGKDYTKEEFDRLMSSGYVQNEEQNQSGLWKRITQDEYINAIKQKQDSKE